MIQFHFWKPWCVERSCGFTLGCFEQLAFVDEQELSLGVDKATDQPRAGDPIHFDVFTSNPLHDLPQSAAANSGLTPGLPTTDS
jgi:hypothetical protein